MGCYTTVPITDEQLTEIISVMKTGGSRQFRKNPRIAEILLAEANLGLRIEDILSLKPSSFILINGERKIDITEKKTKKKRRFSINQDYYRHLMDYVKENDIGRNELIFPIKERAVQKYLEKVTYYLGEDYCNISTHSFRKYCGMKLYEASGHNIILVMKFFQHSSPEITRRYLGVSDEDMEQAIDSHLVLV